MALILSKKIFNLYTLASVFCSWPVMLCTRLCHVRCIKDGLMLILHTMNIYANSNPGVSYEKQDDQKDPWLETSKKQKTLVYT
jgi:hypothetical protein